MAIVDVDGSSLLAYLLAKSVGLVWGLAAIWRSVCIHQMNRVNSRSDHGHEDSTMNIFISISISTNINIIILNGTKCFFGQMFFLSLFTGATRIRNAKYRKMKDQWQLHVNSFLVLCFFVLQSYTFYFTHSSPSFSRPVFSTLMFLGLSFSSIFSWTAVANSHDVYYNTDILYYSTMTDDGDDSIDR